MDPLARTVEPIVNGLKRSPSESTDPIIKGKLLLLSLWTFVAPKTKTDPSKHQKQALQKTMKGATLENEDYS